MKPKIAMQLNLPHRSAMGPDPMRPTSEAAFMI